MLALRSIARRVLQLTAEERELAMAGCAAPGQVTRSSTSSLTPPQRLASMSVSGLYIYDASAG